MNRIFSAFLDRLAERFAALFAGAISSRVEGLHAEVQAEQQSQLEDLARQYETEGKTEIALTLRQRAAGLNSADLAAGAVTMVARLTSDAPTGIPAAARNTQGGLDRLPDFSASPPPVCKRNRKPATPPALGNDTEAAS